MAKSIDFDEVHALDQAGAGAAPGPGAPLGIGHAVNWTLGPSSDREPGNACIGIAIGCALSLPIWLGAAIFYYLLS